MRLKARILAFLTIALFVSLAAIAEIDADDERYGLKDVLPGPTVNSRWYLTNVSGQIRKDRIDDTSDDIDLPTGPFWIGDDGGSVITQRYIVSSLRAGIRIRRQAPTPVLDTQEFFEWNGDWGGPVLFFRDKMYATTLPTTYPAQYEGDDWVPTGVTWSITQEAGVIRWLVDRPGPEGFTPTVDFDFGIQYQLYDASAFPTTSSTTTAPTTRDVTGDMQAGLKDNRFIGIDNDGESWKLGYDPAPMPIHNLPGFYAFDGGSVSAPEIVIDGGAVLEKAQPMITPYRPLLVAIVSLACIWWLLDEFRRY